MAAAVSDQGNFRVGLELDTSPAQAGLNRLYNRMKSGSQQAAAANRPLDKSFDNIITDARAVGLTWDKSVRKFRATQNYGALKSLKTQLKEVGNEMDDVAGDANDLFGSITEGFKGVIQGIPQGIGFSIGNALIEPFRQLPGALAGTVTGFADIERNLRSTLAIAGASNSEFDSLAASMNELAAATKFTTAELAEASTQLARAGFSTTEIKEALPGIATGAAATGESMENMANVVISSLGGFGLGVTETTSVVDMLVVAANNANTSVTELGDGLKYVGPIANELGFEFSDVAATAGLLANSGIKASQMGTALRGGLTRLASAAAGANAPMGDLSRGTANQAEVLERLGVELTDVNGAMKPLPETILALKGGFDKLENTERNQAAKILFGDEAGTAFLSLLNTSQTELETFVSKTSNAAGSAQAASEQMLSGISGALDLLNSAVGSFTSSIGQMGAELFEPLIRGVTGLLNVFNNLDPAAQKFIVGLGLIGGGIAAAAIAIKAYNTALAISNALAVAAGGTALPGLATQMSNLGARIIPGMTAATKALNGAMKADLGLRMAFAWTKFGDALVATKTKAIVLGTALKKLLVATAPIALTIGAVAAAFDTYNRTTGPANEVTNRMSESLDKLNVEAVATGDSLNRLKWEDSAQRVGGFQAGLDRLRNAFGLATAESVSYDRETVAVGEATQRATTALDAQLKKLNELKAGLALGTTDQKTYNDELKNYNTVVTEAITGYQKQLTELTNIKNRTGELTPEQERLKSTLESSISILETYKNNQVAAAGAMQSAGEAASGMKPPVDDAADSLNRLGKEAKKAAEETAEFVKKNADLIAIGTNSLNNINGLAASVKGLAQARYQDSVAVEEAFNKTTAYNNVVKDLIGQTDTAIQKLIANKLAHGQLSSEQQSQLNELRQLNSELKAESSELDTVAGKLKQFVADTKTATEAVDAFATKISEELSDINIDLEFDGTEGVEAINQLVPAYEAAITKAEDYVAGLERQKTQLQQVGQWTNELTGEETAKSREIQNAINKAKEYVSELRNEYVSKVKNNTATKKATAEQAKNSVAINNNTIAKIRNEAAGKKLTPTQVEIINNITETNKGLIEEIKNLEDSAAADEAKTKALEDATQAEKNAKTAIDARAEAEKNAARAARENASATNSSKQAVEKKSRTVTITVGVMQRAEYWTNKWKNQILGLTGAANKSDKAIIKMRSAVAALNQVQTKMLPNIKQLATNLANAKQQFGESSIEAARAQVAYDSAKSAVEGIVGAANAATGETVGLDLAMGQSAGSATNLSNEITAQLSVLDSQTTGLNNAATAGNASADAQNSAGSAADGAVAPTDAYTDSANELANAQGRVAQLSTEAAAAIRDATEAAEASKVTLGGQTNLQNLLSSIGEADEVDEYTAAVERARKAEETVSTLRAEDARIRSSGLMMNQELTDALADAVREESAATNNLQRAIVNKQQAEAAAAAAEEGEAQAAAQRKLDQARLDEERARDEQQRREADLQAAKQRAADQRDFEISAAAQSGSERESIAVTTNRSIAASYIPVANAVSGVTTQVNALKSANASRGTGGSLGGAVGFIGTTAASSSESVGGLVRSVQMVSSETAKAAQDQDRMTAAVQETTVKLTGMAGAQQRANEGREKEQEAYYDKIFKLIGKQESVQSRALSSALAETKMASAQTQDLLNDRLQTVLNNGKKENGEIKKKARLEANEIKNTTRAHEAMIDERIAGISKEANSIRKSFAVQRKEAESTVKVNQGRIDSINKVADVEREVISELDEAEGYIQDLIDREEERAAAIRDKVVAAIDKVAEKQRKAGEAAVKAAEDQLEAQRKAADQRLSQLDKELEKVNRISGARIDALRQLTPAEQKLADIRNAELRETAQNATGKEQLEAQAALERAEREKQIRIEEEKAAKKQEKAEKEREKIAGNIEKSEENVETLKGSQSEIQEKHDADREAAQEKYEKRVNSFTDKYEGRLKTVNRVREGSLQKLAIMERNLFDLTIGREVARQKLQGLDSKEAQALDALATKLKSQVNAQEKMTSDKLKAVDDIAREEEQSERDRLKAISDRKTANKDAAEAEIENIKNVSNAATEAATPAPAATLMVAPPPGSVTPSGPPTSFSVGGPGDGGGAASRSVSISPAAIKSLTTAKDKLQELGRASENATKEVEGLNTQLASNTGSDKKLQQERSFHSTATSNARSRLRQAEQSVAISLAQMRMLGAQHEDMMTVRMRNALEAGRTEDGQIEKSAKKEAKKIEAAISGHERLTDIRIAAARKDQLIIQKNAAIERRILKDTIKRNQARIDITQEVVEEEREVISELDEAEGYVQGIIDAEEKRAATIRDKVIKAIDKVADKQKKASDAVIKAAEDQLKAQRKSAEAREKQLDRELEKVNKITNARIDALRELTPAEQKLADIRQAELVEQAKSGSGKERLEALAALQRAEREKKIKEQEAIAAAKQEKVEKERERIAGSLEKSEENIENLKEKQQKAQEKHDKDRQDAQDTYQRRVDEFTDRYQGRLNTVNRIREKALEKVQVMELNLFDLTIGRELARQRLAGMDQKEAQALEGLARQLRSQVSAQQKSMSDQLDSIDTRDKAEEKAERDRMKAISDRRTANKDAADAEIDNINNVSNAAEKAASNAPARRVSIAPPPGTAAAPSGPPTSFSSGSPGDGGGAFRSVSIPPQLLGNLGKVAGKLDDIKTAADGAADSLDELDVEVDPMKDFFDKSDRRNRSYLFSSIAAFKDIERQARHTFDTRSDLLEDYQGEAKAADQENLKRLRAQTEEIGNSFAVRGQSSIEYYMKEASMIETNFMREMAMAESRARNAMAAMEDLGERIELEKGVTAEYDQRISFIESEKSRIEQNKQRAMQLIDMEVGKYTEYERKRIAGIERIQARDRIAHDARMAALNRELNDVQRISNARIESLEAATPAEKELARLQEKKLAARARDSSLSKEERLGAQAQLERLQRQKKIDEERAKIQEVQNKIDAEKAKFDEKNLKNEEDLARLRERVAQIGDKYNNKRQQIENVYQASVTQFNVKYAAQLASLYKFREKAIIDLLALEDAMTNALINREKAREQGNRAQINAEAEAKRLADEVRNNAGRYQQDVQAAAAAVDSKFDYEELRRLEMIEMEERALRTMMGNKREEMQWIKHVGISGEKAAIRLRQTQHEAHKVRMEELRAEKQLIDSMLNNSSVGTLDNTRTFTGTTSGNPFRFAGGPVDAGSNYTVNELGKEAFLSDSGKLSMINAPSFGTFRPTTDGTVIPAHIAADLSLPKFGSVDINRKPAGAATATQNAKAPSGMNALERVARALLGGKGGDKVTNNVTIQSETPVSAASDMLVSLARLRRKAR